MQTDAQGGRVVLPAIELQQPGTQGAVAAVAQGSGLGTGDAWTATAGDGETSFSAAFGESLRGSAGTPAGQAGGPEETLEKAAIGADAKAAASRLEGQQAEAARIGLIDAAEAGETGVQTVKADERTATSARELSARSVLDAAGKTDGRVEAGVDGDGAGGGDLSARAGDLSDLRQAVDLYGKGTGHGVATKAAGPSAAGSLAAKAGAATKAAVDANGDAESKASASVLANGPTLGADGLPSADGLKTAQNDDVAAEAAPKTGDPVSGLVAARGPGVVQTGGSGAGAAKVLQRQGDLAAAELDALKAAGAGSIKTGLKAQEVKGPGVKGSWDALKVAGLGGLSGAVQSAAGDTRAADSGVAVASERVFDSSTAGPAEAVTLVAALRTAVLPDNALNAGGVVAAVGSAGAKSAAAGSAAVGSAAVGSKADAALAVALAAAGPFTAGTGRTARGLETREASTEKAETKSGSVSGTDTAGAAVASTVSQAVVHVAGEAPAVAVAANVQENAFAAANLSKPAPSHAGTVSRSGAQAAPSKVSARTVGETGGAGRVVAGADDKTAFGRETATALGRLAEEGDGPRDRAAIQQTHGAGTEAAGTGPELARHDGVQPHGITPAGQRPEPQRPDAARQAAIQPETHGAPGAAVSSTQDSSAPAASATGVHGTDAGVPAASTGSGGTESAAAVTTGGVHPAAAGGPAQEIAGGASGAKGAASTLNGGLNGLNEPNGGGLAGAGARTDAGGLGGPHRTLAATPTTLEVGVPNGTEGWLRIRAQVGEQGQVNASLAAGSSAGQEMLHRELPALNAYLHGEQLSVTAAVAERSFAAAGGSVADGPGRGTSSDAGPGQGGTDPGGTNIKERTIKERTIKELPSKHLPSRGLQVGRRAVPDNMGCRGAWTPETRCGATTVQA